MMFTGLVEALAPVVSITDQPPGKRLEIEVPWGPGETALGDSVAINGCCLTVVAIQPDGIAFEAGPETLRRTNLGQLVPGSRVNLERALRVGDRLGGHYVTGHIDATARLQQRRDEPPWAHLWFQVPASLVPHLAPQGSVAVNGVSLTLVEVVDDRFSVALIPHTLSQTNLAELAAGDRVNLETDLLAKYVQQHLAPHLRTAGPSP